MLSSHNEGYESHAYGTVQRQPSPAHAAAHLHALEAINTGDTVTNGQDATQVNDGRLIRLLPLLDGRAAQTQTSTSRHDCKASSEPFEQVVRHRYSHQPLRDVLDEILAAELGLPQLLKRLSISCKAPQGLRLSDDAQVSRCAKKPSSCEPSVPASHLCNTVAPWLAGGGCLAAKQRQRLVLDINTREHQ